MEKIIFISVTVLLSGISYINGFSQNVGINSTGANPDASALLDIGGNVGGDNTGLLIPRMSTTQRNTIASPANSLLIFNTTTTCFEYFYNGVWYNLGCTCVVPSATTATAASGITETSFNANWIASAGVTAYFLDVSTVNTFATFVIGYNNLNVGNVTTFNVTGLTCNTTYFYRVRASNDCGTSPNSNTISLTTSACFTCGNQFTDARDGEIYNTVLIGTQCWMAENLAFDQNAFGNDWCYNNDCPTFQTDYGRLYDWAAVMQGAGSSNTVPSGVQGVCPVGWHVPSDAEWCILENTVEAGTDAVCNLINWRGINTGGLLKEAGTTHWTAPNNCTGNCNNSGFTALPGGFRDNGGSFSNEGDQCVFWTATEFNATFAWQRINDYINTGVFRGTSGMSDGFSVRCVED